MTLGENSLYLINEEFWEVAKQSSEEYSRQFHAGLYRHADKADELMDLCMLYQDLKEHQQSEEQEATYALTEYLFITINPYPDVSLTLLRDTVIKFLRLKPIQGHVAVLEQRGVDEKSCGNGFHSHIIIRQNWLKKSHFKRDIIRVFNRITNYKNYHCLNISNIKDETDLMRRMEYILGEKTDLPGNPKRQKQLMDIKFRKKNKLADYESRQFDEELERYYKKKVSL